MIGPEATDDQRRAPRRVRAGRVSFPGVRASGVVDHVDLDAEVPWAPDGGFWALVVDFEGRLRAWRFAEVDRREPGEETPPPGEWVGPDPGSWRSSLDREAYVAAVESVRAAVHEGEVYQANICRVLEAPLAAATGGPDPWALTHVLHSGNPAPHAATLHVPPADADAGRTGDEGVWIVSASPELFLEVRDGTVTSGPIKGTATSSAGLGAKDEAENIMITDLVRNDLQRVCRPGTVEVIDLLAREEHPGLVHLVTRVRGRLRAPRPTWDGLREATFPPASVSGAPKAAALGIIRALEPVDRGPYCGAIGWWDADSGEAVLAVGIRTFWWTPEAGGTLRFGTGAGITWGSDAAQEWQETELKAARLVALADGRARRGAGPVPARGEQDGQPDESGGSR